MIDSVVIVLLKSTMGWVTFTLQYLQGDILIELFVERRGGLGNEGDSQALVTAGLEVKTQFILNFSQILNARLRIAWLIPYISDRH